MTGLRTLLVGCTLAAAACAAPGAAAPLDDSVRTPAERTAFRALPAVYRVRVTVRVLRLSDDRHRLDVAHNVTITGTAFGAGPDTVVTARHIVRPRAAELLAAVEELGVRGADRFDPNDVRATSRTTAIELRRAAPRPQADPDRVRATIAALTPASSPADLALLRIPGRRNPALPLDDGASRGMEVALIGFGKSPGPTPTIRSGTIGLAGRVSGSDNESLVTLRDIDAERGDSGGPVIDMDGRVHGVLIRRAVAAGDLAVMTRAGEIRRLASGAGVELGATPVQADFTNGMTAFWAHDYTTAAQTLGRAPRQLPASKWIADQADRARAIAAARYEVVHSSPWRVPLILGALASLAVATVLAVRFWTMDVGP